MRRCVVAAVASVFLLVGAPAQAAPCEYAVNETDPFTKQQRVETEWVHIVEKRKLGKKPLLSIGWVAVQGLRNGDTVQLNVLINQANGAFPLANTSTVTFLGADGTVTALATQQTMPSLRTNRNYSQDVWAAFDLPSEAIAALTNGQPITKVRMATMVNPFDAELEPEATLLVGEVVRCVANPTN